MTDLEAAQAKFYTAKAKHLELRKAQQDNQRISADLARQVKEAETELASAEAAYTKLALA